mmetsp:Transcript_21779/g.74881  ORF Transcript_21779/g.74881 Transcript_21779/m.74881 type:complete len:261 (+) Transcript_21779:1393-2175(+)
MGARTAKSFKDPELTKGSLLRRVSLSPRLPVLPHAFKKRGTTPNKVFARPAAPVSLWANNRPSWSKMPQATACPSRNTGEKPALNKSCACSSAAASRRFQTSCNLMDSRPTTCCGGAAVPPGINSTCALLLLTLLSNCKKPFARATQSKDEETTVEVYFSTTMQGPTIQLSGINSSRRYIGTSTIRPSTASNNALLPAGWAARRARFAAGSSLSTSVLDASAPAARSRDQVSGSASPTTSKDQVRISTRAPGTARNPSRS